MGLVLLIEEDCRPVVDDLCARTGVEASWSLREGRRALELGGSDEDGRFVTRRLQALGVPFEVAAVDGKELRPTRW